MSGIYGRINLDGEPLEASQLQAMAEAMAPYGRDRSGVWLERPVGIGHLLAFKTPESLHEEQPYEEDGLLISADARLDNRRELSDLLSIPASLSKDTSDSQLILLAYLILYQYG